MNSAVNYGLSGLGWPPWSIPLSVLAHELSSYFLRFVDMICTLHGLRYGTLSACALGDVSIIWYVNLKAVLPSVIQAVCALQSLLP